MPLWRRSGNAGEPFATVDDVAPHPKTRYQPANSKEHQMRIEAISIGTNPPEDADEKTHHGH